jgi:hypothetical protein
MIIIPFPRPIRYGENQMGRPRTSKVLEVKSKLLVRLRDGLHRPGDRFMSNRAVAQQFNISYQTADRLIRELCAEGYLVRREASGTYLPGARPVRFGAELLFHERAKRAGSFGARLFAQLTARLDRDRIPWRVRWIAEGAGAKLRLARDHFPVLWECPEVLNACVSGRRSALLLNARPPSGIDSVYIDSVSTDDFSGGVCAAQLLARRSGPGGPLAVVAGPPDDPRSNDRVAGFLSVAKATVVQSPTWYLEGGMKVARDAIRAGRSGIFCCNDRLAEAILLYCRESEITCPPLVGFDDAPVAEDLNLTTIAIPWGELVNGAADVIKRRLADDTSTASRQIFAPRPVVRRL